MKQYKHEKALKIILNLSLLSIVTMIITFIFSSDKLNPEFLTSYFQSITILFMNLFPIIIFMSIVFILSNKLWLSFLITNTVFVTASLVNKFKLTYRDDPFTFIDLKLFNESIAMTKRYDIKITFSMILMILGLLGITVLLKKFFKEKIESPEKRFYSIIGIFLIATIVFGGVYFNKDIYRNAGNEDIINIWSQQQQFQSRGFVYPFIYSISYSREDKLENYDEEKAKAALDKYKYNHIPRDKKVNVVGIMLEAYSDFSVFENIDIDEEVYGEFHKLQENSIHGNLVTNVFGGGTINTERGFLTGFQHHPLYSKPTNSFVWYFKEQGYNTKAMHPVYGWFYNRRNVNDYLGFDKFDYYENAYQEKNEEFYYDTDFFDFIIEDYEKNRDKNIPYFNFSVTYQNHGTYSNKKVQDREYLKRKENYNESDYNIINNYLRGVSDTGKAIKKLVDYFEKEKEPVVLVIFGDHKPWLGEESTGYEMLDINMDLSTIDGFLNYYQTPYVIWGNSSVEAKIGNEFKGKKEDISPNFLMPEVFEQLGLKGNEYMQYLTDLKKDIDVDHELYFKENGKYTQTLKPENKKKFEDFINLEYYYNKNFIKKY